MKRDRSYKPRDSADKPVHLEPSSDLQHVPPTQDAPIPGHLDIPPIRHAAYALSRDPPNNGNPPNMPKLLPPPDAPSFSTSHPTTSAIHPPTTFPTR